VAEEDVVSLND